MITKAIGVFMSQEHYEIGSYSYSLEELIRLRDKEWED
jgi:hypothetical protein